MATNIEREDNLVSVSRNTKTKIYDETRKDDLLSESLTTLIVVFKDKDGVYPNGKVIVSKEYVTKYTYDYTKDIDGNITSCIVTKTHSKSGQSIDFEKTQTKTYYNANGRVIRIEHDTRDGVTYRVEKMWYYSDGTLKEKHIKGTHVIDKFYYNTFGGLVLKTSYTIKSKTTTKSFSAIYNELGEVVHESYYDRNYGVTIERDKDHTGNLLSITKIFRHINDRKIFSKETKIYDPNADYKLSRTIKNGFVTEEIKYDLNGEILETITRDKDGQVVTIFERHIDEESGEKTIDRHIYITDKHGKMKTKYIRATYDEDNALLLYSEDNSIVTTYTYDENNRRTFAITKQLIDGDFVIVSTIEYEYTEDIETGKKIRTRKEERYDKNGNTIFKNSYQDSQTDIEKESITEFRKYEIV